VLNMVYDAGALICAEENDPRFWQAHRRLTGHGLEPLVPAAVLAQVIRNGSRQARLHRALGGCTVVDFDEESALLVGALLADAKTEDVVDASVVITARMHGEAIILTSDVGDLEHLVNAAQSKILVKSL
jgi:PIN domain